MNRIVGCIGVQSAKTCNGSDSSHASVRFVLALLHFLKLDIMLCGSIFRKHSALIKYREPMSKIEWYAGN